MNTKGDKILLSLSLLYILFPILLFLYYWFNVYIFIIGVILLSYSFFSFQKNIKETCLINKNNILFWAISLISIIIWVYLSGIGGYSFQNDDFWVRNPIYHDLCTEKWPLVYNLSENTLNVQHLIGKDKVLFVYYLTFYLFPSWITKIFSFTEQTSLFILFIYSIIGVFLGFYLTIRVIKECKYKYLLIFIFFSGLDILEYLIIFKKFPCLFEYLEWSSILFQYDGNTSNLFWIYNQIIPIWIIMGLFLLIPKNKSLGVGALSFAYSPFSTLGLLPVFFYQIINDDNKNLNWKQKIKSMFTTENIIIPLFMIFTYGSFYSVLKGHFILRPMLLEFMDKIKNYDYIISIVIYILYYITFIATEFLIYYIIMSYGTNKEIFKWKYSKLVLILLLIYPHIYFNDGNFVMRASIPILYIFMLFIMKFYKEYKNKYVIILTIFLIIGSITSLFEIGRSFSKNGERGFISISYMDKPFQSYFYYLPDDKLLDQYIRTTNIQFFGHDYQLSFYYKISKNNN